MLSWLGEGGSINGAVLTSMFSFDDEIVGLQDKVLVKNNGIDKRLQITGHRVSSLFSNDSEKKAAFQNHTDSNSVSLRLFPKTKPNEIKPK